MTELFPAVSEPITLRVDTVADVVKHLCRLFPKHATETTAWTPVYFSELGGVDREALQELLRTVLGSWARRFPPLPGDFKPKVAEARERPANRTAGPRRGREFWTRVAATRGRLTHDWQLRHAQRLGETDADHAAKLLSRVGDKAALYAQYLELGVRIPDNHRQFLDGCDAGVVNLTAAEIENARACFESQRDTWKRSGKERGVGYSTIGDVADRVTDQAPPRRESEAASRRRSGMQHLAEDNYRKHVVDGEPVDASDRRAALEASAP
jgi:hypothetical protein